MTDSPTRTGDGPGPAPWDAIEEAFSKLGDETRLRIILELARISNASGGGLSFSELRDRVGVKDSGRFNYHLDKLKGTFLEHRDGEYVARYPARAVTSSVAAGTFGSAESGDRKVAEHDKRCYGCGEQLQLKYEDHTLWTACPDCGLMDGYPAPPGAHSDRSLDELWAAVSERGLAMLNLARQGICIECWGPMAAEYPNEELASERVPGYDDDRDRVFVTLDCEHCPNGRFSPLRSVVGTHPDIVSFVTDDGGSRRQAIRALNPGGSADVETTLHATDPATATLNIESDGEKLTVTVDENCAVEEFDYR